MRTWIEISRENLRHNLDTFFRLTGSSIAFVVKANAYGHGIEQAVSIARSLPFVSYFAVDSPDEALRVRKLDSSRKILAMGWADESEIRELVANEIEMVIPSPDHLALVRKAAGELNRSACCHLKVETGTNRMGMDPEAVVPLLEECRKGPVKIRGLYSHFANIEDTTDHGYAFRQLEIFQQLAGKTREFPGLIRHFACSAAALLFPRTVFDMPRVGISSYGYWPSHETLISFRDSRKEKIELRPVLSWHSRVAQVKHVPRGRSVGYGLSFRTFSDSKIAVVPVGYYDGYDRRLSNTANILVNGISAPVRGRICMNMFMADVTHIPGVRAGDPVTLLGSGSAESIDAADLAGWSGTIHYEVLARINQSLPRVIA